MAISNKLLYCGLDNHFLLVAIWVTSSFLVAAYNANIIPGAVDGFFSLGSDPWDIFERTVGRLNVFSIAASRE